MIDSRSITFCLANYYFFRGLEIFFNPSWTVGVPGDPKENFFRVNQKCYVILFPLLYLTNSKLFYAYPIAWMIYYSTRAHQSLFEYPTLSMKYYCSRVQIGERVLKIEIKISFGGLVKKSSTFLTKSDFFDYKTSS